MTENANLDRQFMAKKLGTCECKIQRWSLHNYKIYFNKSVVYYNITYL